MSGKRQRNSSTINTPSHSLLELKPKQIAMMCTHDLSMVTLLINVLSCPGATGLSLKLG